jgi:F420-dependent oxidoreductase-like protein
MRIGIGVGGRTVDDAVRQVGRAADDGFAHAWFSNIFGLDALTACAIAGRETSGRIEVGTAVVPAQPRHPFAMAQQAASVHEACGGRLALGIGLSHQVVIADMLGLPWERPASFMEEYLSVLVPLLREGAVSFSGDFFRVHAQLERAYETPPSVIVAALGPRMLSITGRLADGTATWMTGPETIERHVVPTISTAAAEAGRPAPRVVMALPVCVTADAGAARAPAAKVFNVYAQLPAYRAMLDREGAAGPEDVAIIGDEDAVAARIRGFADIGVTDFDAALFGERDDMARTREVLRSLV